MRLKKKQYGDGFGIATLFETTLSKEQKLTDEINAIKLKKRNKHLVNFKSNNELQEYKVKVFNTLKPKTDCIGCSHQKDTESFFTHEMLRIYQNEEFRLLFENENVLLCRLHFIYTLTKAAEREAMNYFIEAQRIKLERLSFLVSEFIRKHDYRFQKELNNNDIKSWTKLLEYFGSKKNIDRNGYNNLFQ